MPSRAVAILAAAALAAAPGGCSAGHHGRAADLEAAAILAGGEAAVRDSRDRTLLLPRPSGPGEEGRTPEGTAWEAPVPVPEVMSLEDALRIATLANRDYRSRMEGLTLSALSLSGARFRFSPRFTATLSYVVADAKGAERADTARGTAGASQVLPTGGTVSVTGTESATDDRPAGKDFSSTTSVGVSLSQPLLRGAGYEASHESLTQAERGLVYAIRDFARFREQFVIDVTRRYYDILARRIALRNTEDRLAAVDFQTRRTQALFEIGRQDKIEVLRAENDLLRVRNDLVDARDGLSLAVDQFKVFLGLPTSVEFAFAEETPEFRPVDVSLSSAVEAALANRFDLANAREQLEDAERAVRIARNGLLPDLGLEASWQGGGPPATGFFHDPTRTQSSSVGLVLQVPLQQTLERNAMRSAEIALDRERRAFRQFRDDLVVEVREALRRLRQAEVSLEIQKRIIEVEEKREEKARLDFEAGLIGNRDLLEAQQSRLDARNDRIRRAVDYEIARISLERAMGTMEVGPEGTWRGRRAPSAAAGTTGENP